jgi:hypothetical protein
MKKLLDCGAKLSVLIVAALLCGSVSAQATCSNTVLTASDVTQLSQSDRARICDAGTRGLGLTLSSNLFQRLAKVTYLIERSGGGEKSDLAFQLMSIVKLRGQASDESRALQTLEISWKIFSGTDGRVPPSELVAFLANAKGLARTLTDDGLIDMAAVISVQNRSR